MLLELNVLYLILTNYIEFDFGKGLSMWHFVGEWRISKFLNVEDRQKTWLPYM